MPRYVSLQMDRETVVARAIVAAKDRDVGNERLQCRIGRDQWRRSGGVVVAPVAVISLLVGVIGAEQPVVAEGVLEAGGRVNGVGRAIAGVNARAGRHAAAVRRIGRILRINARASQSIYGLQRLDPAILGQVVVIQTKPSAENSLRTLPRRVDDAESRCKSFAIVVRRTLGKGRGRNVQ